MTRPVLVAIAESPRFQRRYSRYRQHCEQVLDRQWALGEFLILSGPPCNPRPLQEWELDWQYQPELLVDIDPASEAVDAAIAWTAMEYATSIEADELARYRWSGYAYRSLRRLLGPSHDRTMYAAAILADACRREDPERAAALHREVAHRQQRRGRLAAADEARLDLASALHAAGHCAEAHELTTQLWRNWRRRQRPGQRGACRTYRTRQLTLGVHVAAHLLYVHSRCGQAAVAMTLLADSRIYLPRTYAPASTRSLRLTWDRDPRDGHDGICTVAAASKPVVS